MSCVKCNDHGIVRKDGQRISNGEQCSIRQLVTLYDPCDFCKEGEKEATLFTLVRRELSYLLTDRDGKLFSQGELTRIGV